MPPSRCIFSIGLRKDGRICESFSGSRCFWRPSARRAPFPGSASPFLRSRTGARTSSAASRLPGFRLRFNRSPATRSGIRSQLITPIIRCRAEDTPPPNSSTARMRKASAASSGKRIRRISASPSSRSPESRWRSCCSAMSSAKAPRRRRSIQRRKLAFSSPQSCSSGCCSC